MSEIYWSHTYGDLKLMLDLRMQFEQVRVISMTESFSIVAAQVFGSADDRGDVEEIDTLDAALNFARQFQ